VKIRVTLTLISTFILATATRISLTATAQSSRPLSLALPSQPAFALQSSNLELIGHINISGIARAVVVRGDYAYVAADSSGLRVINVSNPASPVEVGFYDTPGVSYGVEVRGDYAYVADGTALRIINISNPASPVQVGSYTTVGVYDVALSGNYAYLAVYNGLWVIMYLIQHHQ